MRERRVLGQGLCLVLSTAQIPGLGYDMVWDLDIGSTCGLVPGSYDALHIGWSWGQVPDTSEDPDMN